MIFGNLGGLKLPDICLIGEEKPRKIPHPGNLSRPGIEPGPAAWQARMLPPGPQRRTPVLSVTNVLFSEFCNELYHRNPQIQIKYRSLPLTYTVQKFISENMYTPHSTVSNKREIIPKCLFLYEIYRHLCQVYGHTHLDGQYISYRSSAGRCLIIHPIARTSPLVISSFSYTPSNNCSVSVSVFRMTEAEISVTVVPIPGGGFLRHRDTKVGPTLWQMYQFTRVP